MSSGLDPIAQQGSPDLLDALLNGTTPEHMAQLDALLGITAPQLDTTQEVAPQQSRGQRFIEGLGGLQNQQQGAPQGLGQGFLSGLSGGLGRAGTRIAVERAKHEAAASERQKERDKANAVATAQYRQEQLGGRKMLASAAIADRAATLRSKAAADAANARKPTPAEIRADAKARAEGTAAGTPPKAAEPDEAIMSPDAIQKRVEIYAAGGAEPSFGMGKAGVANRVAFNNALGKLPGTGADIQGGRATYGAEKANLGNLIKTQGSAKAFGDTAEKNLKQVESALKTLPDLGAPLFNAPLRAIYGALGSQHMAAWNTAMIPVRNEFTRLINSPSGAGVITDAMRDEMHKILDPNASKGQILTSIAILRQDFKNRISAYDQDIADTKTRLSQINTPTAAAAARPPIESFNRP